MATQHVDRARDFAARAALVYLIAGSAWILLSDRLVELVDLPEGFNPQTVKGLLFVLVTGLILYWTVRRWAGRAVRYRERALQAEERRLAADRMVSAVFDASPLAGMVLDPDGTVLRWSPSAGEMFGWTAEEAVGTRNPIVPEEKLDEYEKLRRRVREDGAFIGVEAVRRRKDGSRLHVSISAAPLRDADGEVYAVASFIEDITTRVERERELETYRMDLEELVAERTRELEEANLAKSRFLAAMSHELRTPLNSVIGFSGILQQELVGTLTEEQHRQVGMIQQSGRHLLALISDILDLSKIEAGRIEVHVEEFDVLGLAREAVDVLSPLAGEVSLSVESEEDAVTVRSDEEKVRQILLNLASNAVKFTEEGAVTVRVHSTDAGAEIAVEDTGIGIPEDRLPDLFDPFTQVETRAGAKTKGAGLGLAICKEYADMIGGRIRVRSEPGVGSTFTLHVPGIVPDID